MCGDCGEVVTHRDHYCPECATKRRDAISKPRLGPRGGIMHQANPERERRIPVYRDSLAATGRIVYLPETDE